ncbi:uncharacterized protein I206_105772 [Kwoniella pini CBS 10737]|uniref:Major facilitator superfamily (MFS) profile domain-containing protein n=1 Tax=Kwoniella pini CBS 10737 TaxID=1296096 RepID=A0A1B9I069_9TREE|nr:uncharacterized protein I206_04592 [Kwoniella pini CBS 10737]OCF48905.1 hypothetical protein I206_04592 [Kwoniella pini CBS 10737]
MSTLQPGGVSPSSTSSEDLSTSSYSDNEKIQLAQDRKGSEEPLRTPPLETSEKGVAAHYTSQPLKGADGNTLDILDGIPPLAEGGAPVSGSAFGKACLRIVGIGKKNAAHHGTAIATQPSVFDTPQREQYAPKQWYEGYVAFDPLFRWTWSEETKVVRIIDFKIFLWVTIMFLALDIDRYNITAASADNLLKDLKMTQADYNLGNTLFRVGFLVAELPSQLVSKRLGPDVWLPIQMIIFSIIACSQFWLNGRTSFLVTRFLISFFQGGFIPDVILYLSYYYTKSELAIRLSFFWVSNYLANLITAFLAVGILEMRGVAGKSGWAWLFLINGLITLVVGILSFFLLPPSVSQSKSWQPKRYFTDDQVKIVVNRALRDDPTKSSMHNRQALPIKTIFRCMGDYQMYPLYLIGLLFGVGSYPVSQYFQISMKGLGFTTLQSNLLSIPNIIWSIINIIGITILSEVVNSRAWVCMAEDIWMLPNYIALLALPDPIGSWTYFAISTVLLSFPYVHAIQVSWTSRNSGSVENRTVSASLYNISVQLSAIIGANLYQASDKPRYKHANSAIVGIILFNLVILYPGTRWYYKSINKKRELTWDNMTSEQKTEYLETTTDKGNKRLDFRFSY